MRAAGSKIGIVCCSNGQSREYEGKIKKLERVLRNIGLEPIFSEHIYVTEEGYSSTGLERASALMDFYRDDEIKGIFDISGGDLANGVLPYLDYDVIADSSKVFWGYSDLTTVINAIYAKTGKASVLYQIRNLIYDYGEQQTNDFKNTVIGDADDLFETDYHFLSGNDEEERPPASADKNDRTMRGIVVGGNIRCFLKLAGTEYMPDLTDKILLLESYRGDAARIETYLCQLEQMGVFQKISGILLGTFTEMQHKKYEPDIRALVRRYAGMKMPVAVTGQIGHGTDAKAVWIGKEVGRTMKLMSAYAPCKV